MSSRSTLRSALRAGAALSGAFSVAPAAARAVPLALSSTEQVVIHLRMSGGDHVDGTLSASTSYKGKNTARNLDKSVGFYIVASNTAITSGRTPRAATPSPRSSTQWATSPVCPITRGRKDSEGSHEDRR